ncbi:flavodoxin [Shewanella avicenniae]|uniref:Flavodoxin n=1 Tax=Shewanella avicenniae TaxID=2814294 RepID=A0ABX7QM62_9GAMM|nr:flavodoxin [Shewanella avicenniae]QSX32536.1 flavodoxin [Shewanella avicenniae]
MKKISLVFGSVYGSAESVADTLYRELENRGIAVELHQPESLSDYVPNEDELLLMVCSTTGDGDLPDNILPWFLQMKDRAPYLPELTYAVVALGDSSYDTFCGGGHQLDELFSELCAKRLGDVFEIDACETMEPENEALGWLKKWLKLLK